MLEIFQTGGIGVWAILCFTVVSMPLALVAVFMAFASKKRGAAIAICAAAILMGLLTFGVGLGSYLYALHQIEEALMYMSGEDRALIEAVGRQEAMASIYCGLAGAILPLLIGGVGLLRALTRSPAA